jgi:ribosomal protein S18 acetylase RimI-like enzyme
MRHITNIQTRLASVADLDLIAPLFDAYRAFYGEASDLARARAFLLERFQHSQSILFIATHNNDVAIGFTQLYPSFSSVSVARIFILNDLYVTPAARRSGAAARLLKTAANYGRAVGAKQLVLSTAVSNEPAQALYVAEGWIRENSFYEYSLSL